SHEIVNTCRGSTYSSTSLSLVSLGTTPTLLLLVVCWLYRILLYLHVLLRLLFYLIFFQELLMVFLPIVLSYRLYCIWLLKLLYSYKFFFLLILLHFLCLEVWRSIAKFLYQVQLF